MNNLIVGIFVGTFGICLFNALYYISVLSGNSISWPRTIGFKYTEPTIWYLIYPSTFFQIWFWFSYCGFFN